MGEKMNIHGKAVFYKTFIPAPAKIITKNGSITIKYVIILLFMLDSFFIFFAHLVKSKTIKLFNWF